MLVVLLACAAPATDSVGTDPGPSDRTGSDTAASDTGDTAATPHCAEVDGFVPQYAAEVARFVAEDTLAPGPEAPVVFVGSSSIRRWEELHRTYADHGPVQRGLGGAQLGEVAAAADALVVRHAPRAVVVFAGTNDVAAGVGADVVIERFRCFRDRVATGLGADVPVLFFGITPAPARWDQWEEANAVNRGVQALAADDPAIHYLDAPRVFLATGTPPDASLFAGDGLHLSAAGYAVWNDLLRPALDAAAPAPARTLGTLTPGTRLLIDLGPSNAEDGELTPSPDHLGQWWNNWHPIQGDDEVLPGEHSVRLVDDAGGATGVDLVITGGFFANGRSNGGLLWPDAARLGALAVGSATGDYFYAVPDDQTGGIALRGLDPDRRYTLRLFAARDDPERRVTRYTVYGVGESTTLQTSGAGSGSGTTNDDTVVEFTPVVPDPYGNLHVDVSVEEGPYAYLSLVELIVTDGGARAATGRSPSGVRRTVHEFQVPPLTLREPVSNPTAP